MQETIIAHLTLDTFYENNVEPLVVPQGDYGARSIVAKLTSQGKPLIVDKNTETVSIIAERSADGQSEAFSGSVNDDGTVKVPITQWMLEHLAVVYCNVVITRTGGQYSSANFLLEPQKRSSPTEISEDDPRQDLITEVLAGEQTRLSAEEARQSAEEERQSSEAIRIDNETERASAEASRATAETARAAADVSRAEAETARAERFDGWVEEIGLIDTFNDRISRNSKRITNLENGIVPSPFVTDSTVAGSKAVPPKALPYAVIEKLGGMSHVVGTKTIGAAVTEVVKTGKNIISFGVRTDKKAGVTYSAQADGGISISGTPTANSSFTLDEFIVSGLSGFWITSFGTFKNVGTRCFLYSADVKSPFSKDVRNNTPFYVDLSKYPTAAYAKIQIAENEDGVECSGTIYPMISLEKPIEFEKGEELTTLSIPAEVQALDGYGLGINANCNNHISWDDDGKATFNKQVGSFVISSDDISKPTWVYDDVDYYRVPKPLDALDYNAYSNNYLCDWEHGTSPWEETTNIGKTSGKPELLHYWFGFAKGTTLAEAQQALVGKTIVYQLATPEVTDISDIITRDNLIEVTGGGIVEFKNQYNLAPASTITYQTKEEAV